MLDSIVEKWVLWRKKIDDKISETLSSLPEAAAIEAVKYIVEGGKRFRGFLAILVAEELGGKGSDALEAAVALELVHASSLALDDIIDLDVTRRGRPAAWIALGIQKTVMVSNLLIPLAQSIILRQYGYKALEKTINAWLNVSRGEILDVFYLPDELPVDYYYKIARLKTGALFRLSAELGAIAARKHDMVETVGDFGEKLGIAYQVADDLVDLVLEKRGRRIKASTGYMLFRRLVGDSVEEAVKHVVKAVREAKEAAEKLGSTILTQIPYFMAAKMLEEVGLPLEQQV